jgi:hypothetical protein
VFLEQIMTSLGLSDLQFALAVIGLGILILVALLNLRYAHVRKKAKAQNALEKRFAPGFADISSTQNETEAEQVQAPVIMSSEKAAIDPRIDCVISLRFDEPISGQEILKEMEDWQDIPGPSGVQWMCEGLNVNVDEVETWEPIQSDAIYSELQLAIQLASRRGPIGVLELSDFCSRVQLLAETLGSQIDMPTVSAMLESAEELDRMAAESDIQLSINEAFDEPCSWKDLAIILRQRGFHLSRNGRSYEFGGPEAGLFKSAELDPNQSVKQFTLLLEFPLVPESSRAFERMLAEGVAVAQIAHGRLVDDNGMNLSEAAVTSIRQHLDVLYIKLDKSGIPAGSSTAIRLFS